MRTPQLLFQVTTMACGLLLCSCQSSHLIFVQSAIIGIDITASTETAPLRGSVGYDRYTVAYVPKTNLSDAGATEPEYDAMSVISKSKVAIRFRGHSEIHEHFATGQAAINLAKSSEGMEKLGESVQ